MSCAEESKTTPTQQRRGGVGSSNAYHNGMFNFFFSNKRTIDKLRLRITQAIQEQLESATAPHNGNGDYGSAAYSSCGASAFNKKQVTPSSIRVWFSDEQSVERLREQLSKAGSSSSESSGTRLSEANKEKTLTGNFRLEKGSCIDSFGQNLVDQVFYEQRVSYLVVEIAEKNKDAYLLAGSEAGASADTEE